MIGKILQSCLIFNNFTENIYKMIIERNKDEVVIRLSGKIAVDKLQDMADFIKYIEISGKSKATANDAENFIDNIKKGRWERNKAKMTK